MIIDFHTHIFPPEVRDNRDDYLRRDPTFAEMYSSPKAKLATAEDLLAGMEDAEIDVSVALGFAWTDQDLIARHNDYILESASRSDGRIVPFTTVNMNQPAAVKEIERCAAAGARGLGELRPDNQAWTLSSDAGEALAEIASRRSLILLFHVTEPVGHEYPGKRGGDLAEFYRFALKHPELTIVGAHIAGGLPFYAPMPEVRDVFTHLYIDTAAERLLYNHTAYAQIAHFIGPERVLFGSDYPLVPQAREIAELGDAVHGADDLPLILGGNAQRLLGL